MAKLAAALERVPQHVVLGVHPSLTGEESRPCKGNEMRAEPPSLALPQDHDSGPTGREAATAPLVNVSAAPRAPQSQADNSSSSRFDPARASVHSSMAATSGAAGSSVPSSRTVPAQAGGRSAVAAAPAAGGSERDAQRELEDSLDALLSLGTATAAPRGAAAGPLSPSPPRAETFGAPPAVKELAAMPVQSQLRPRPAQPAKAKMGAAELEDWLDL